MAGHFLTLLESIVSDPDQCISSLSILSDAEQRQVLQEWTEVKSEKRESVFAHELFEAQARQTPNSVAVTFQNESVTYHELDQRANQMARYLQTLGVGPEVPVGICLERSIGLVTALLAILKAGGACLPLDPGLPSDRLAYMLAAAHCPLVLTEGQFEEKITKLGARKVYLDKSQGLLSQYETTPPANGLIEGNLAQIFFTSGSTGDPKGVMWNHRKQPRQGSWIKKTLGLSESDRHLMKSPIGLTPLNTEIFWPLLTGGQLIIAPSGIEQDTAALVKLMAEQKITVTTFVPSLLRIVLEEPGLEDCSSLRKVMCFGEKLSSELESLFFDRLSADLSVVYGATEAPSATFRECRRGQSFAATNIGRRIPGKQIYVLDAHRQLVPIGVPGEIYIGGESLARGYLNRPDLTEERFVSNPFSDAPGARIYKTGDRGRYLSDGSLEFLGRTDFQVKIRGFRVEPGEIETSLEKHPSVHKALVVAQEDGRREECLVAYGVSKHQQTLTPRELRGFLKQKVPGYLIPSAFVLLDRLPLTDGGKLNRRALPGPDWGGIDSESAYVPPNTPMEELLAKIWGELLNLEQVSIRNDFFDLGGHSLLATQLMSRVRKTFSVDLPLRALFENPTIESLAVAIVEVLAARLDHAEIPELFQFP
jgi:amino acid adenylation domain-containing protein